MKRNSWIAVAFLGVAALGWIWWSGAREGARSSPSIPGARGEAAPVERATSVESVASVESVEPDEPAGEPREVAAVPKLETTPAEPQAGEPLLRVQVLAREDLAPLAGVRLMLSRTDGEQGGGGRHVERSRAAAGECPRTDAAGWAEFECSSGIPYAVRSIGVELESARIEAPPLAQGERRELQLLVGTRDDLTLFGVLLDGETKSPVLGGELRSELGARIERISNAPTLDEAPARPSDAPTLARADAEGRFELRGASWKPRFARATAPGCAPTVFQIAAGHSDAANPLQVLLWRSGTLDVSVANSAGVPIADALVVVSTRSRYLMQDTGLTMSVGEDPRWSAESDAQGRAWLEGLVPRAPLDVVTRPPNADPRAEAQPVTLAPGERRALQIRIGTGAVIQGRVIDDRSEPVRDREIWRVAARWPAGQAVLLQRTDKPAATARTDAQGGFRFDDVPVGVWSVGLAPPERLPPKLAPPELRRFPACAETVEVDGSESSLELLLLVHPDLFLRGTVVDPDGKPAAKCHVDAWRSGASMHPDAQSDESGAFELGPLPAGAWDVRAGTFGTHFAPSLPLTAGAGTGDLVLRLRPGALVSGRIVKDGTSDQLECETKLTQVDSPFHMRSTRSRGGRFEFKGLLPGTYVVVARDFDGGIGVTPEIRLESGQQDTEREIQLQPGAKLALRYEGERKYIDFELFTGGQRLERDRVQLGRPLQKTVLPGSIELRWRAGESPKSSTVVLAAGETKEVVLDELP